MRRVIFLLSALLLMSGCSLQKIALKTTSGLFSYGMDALYAEPDLGIAEIAVASNLKLLEGFHLADPKNKNLLEMLTQGYASFSLAFLEETEPERASAIYLRARDFGFHRLGMTKAFKGGIPAREEDFVKRLPLLGKSDLPALFWTAFAWAGWVNLNRDDPQAIFDLSKVKAMMNRVLELDEGFFFGGAHLFWGSINGSIPRMLGGDPEKARESFEHVIELTDGKFLIAYVYYARYYAVSTLDEALFDDLLNKVLAAPMDILPGYELMTSLAKRQAESLLAQKDDLL